MVKVEYMIYFYNANMGIPFGEVKETLNEALAFAEAKRKSGFRFVTMVSENVDSVGKPGADSVRDGKTPDGQVYDWVMRRDGDVRSSS